jgi:hypothetical protein
LFTPRFSFKGGKQDWFTYNGGLTTPGCFEIVCLLRLDKSISDDGRPPPPSLGLFVDSKMVRVESTSNWDAN